MIIGITGKKGSGKDTACKIIQELYPNAERRAFADKLKQSVGALFKMGQGAIEHWKNDDSAVLSIDYPYWGGGGEPLDWPKMTGREILQRYGTEAHREIFGDDFWLEQCLSLQEEYSDKLVVVTDVRFLNEAAWIKGLGGLIFKIHRGSVEGSGDVHPSEKELEQIKADYDIQNNGTLDQLKTAIMPVLKGVEDYNGGSL